MLQRTYTRVGVVQLACVPAMAVPGCSPLGNRYWRRASRQLLAKLGAILFTVPA